MKQHECAATKICKKCGTEKSVSEFHSYFDNRKNKSYLKANCKSCYNQQLSSAYLLNEDARVKKLAKQA
jgi:hypothetical protein